VNPERPTHGIILTLAAVLPLVACGGTGDPGLVVDPSVVAVAVTPSSAQLQPSAPQPFVATVTGTTNASVVWQVTENSTGGTIDAAGLYHAPSSPGTFHVVATSVADGTKSATATVTVTATPAVVSVSVSPQTRSVSTGGTVQFTATVSGTSDTRSTWSVTEGSSGGTVDATGLYLAPSSPGTFHVVATSVADGTKSATATVTVTTPPPPPISLAAQFDVLSRHALFFDHASVGENLMDGVAGLLSTVSSAKPTLINMNVSNGGLRPDLIHTGIWAESMKLALLNGSPMDKVATFKTDLASGMGAKVDIAFMKFCFVDFTSATDVDALFAAYQSMITSVKALYPGIHFVHVTAPLESPSNDAFNAKREAYSAKVRTAYGADVFDLALFESTRPDGTRETVGGVPALVPAYTSDSGHLNATGQAKVVPELVKFLANLP
jgi:acyl-coenzyme A thioesterase PaaI-like protein